MRHGKKFNHLGRKKGHRRALLMNLSNALIEHKRINTTLAKAKALRVYIEPLITRGKDNSTNSRRVVFSHLQSKEAIKELFGNIAAAIGDRPGGYTRVIKTGFRKGDGAEMAMIEMVDFNEVYTKAKAGKSKTSTRRSRSKSKKSTPVAVDSDSKITDEVAKETSSSNDDLTKIEGIGPKIAELLNKGGLTTFSALAIADVDAIKSILADAGSRYTMHNPTTWPMQSKMAADGNWDELKKWQDLSDGGKPLESSEEE